MMKNRKSRSLRQRRRRLLLQVLASISVSAGAVGYANESDYFAGVDATAAHAYYAADSDDVGYHVAPVAAQQSFGSTQQEEFPPAPVPDAVTDKFLADEAELNALEPPVASSDVDAVVDGATAAAPSVVFDPQPLAPIGPPQFESIGDIGGFSAPSAATAGTLSSVPSVMGDLSGLNLLGSLLGATIAVGGGDRRFKVSENVSPVPQDRVFFNYNHFENALTDINGGTASLDRYTFGFEKTFYDGLASIETRMPFAGGLNTTQVVGSSDTRATEFGNLAFALKANLMSGDCWMLSCGTTLSLPTGDDYQVFDSGTRQLLVKNDAVHLAPFLGYVTRPNNRWFAQGFLQADFDLNGNDVFTTGDTFQGVLQDQNLLFMDASIGRWLHRNCDPCAKISAIAGIFELHYTTTLNDTDGVAGITNPFNRMDILNATGAIHVQMGQSALRVGGAAPLTDDEERLFDAEVIVQFNRYF